MKKTKTAFIVDDCESIQMIYEKLLNFSGFNVVGIAGNGQEAVDKFKEFKIKPDLVIIDHRLPLKNGIEAAKEIIQMDGTSKIIITSADSDVRNEALSIGAYRFLDKTCRLESIKVIFDEISA
jgi:two-component system chemotaxis response regulator CheY